MASPSPPAIFSQRRRIGARRRMLGLQRLPNAPRYVIVDMVEDVLERLGFLRLEPKTALVIGDHTGGLAQALTRLGAGVTGAEPAEGFDEEQPLPFAGFDLIASLGTLDTVNDLPGALIQLRHALAPGGLLIASFPGAGSLPALRAAMLAADGARPAPRLHPQVDVRAGGQLLQRAGFAEPVADSRGLDLRFSGLARLIADLRAQGLSNCLARPGPSLSRRALSRASAHFGEGTAERIELLTLSGRRPA